MAKPQTTLRQKDISRLLRDRKALRGDKIKGQNYKGRKLSKPFRD